MRNFGSVKQGDVGVGQAIAYFTSIGATISIPLSDSQEYDLVVDLDGKLNKVQVKTTTHKAPSGNYCAALKTCGGNQSWNKIAKKFDGTAVDYLFVTTEELDSYLIPTEEFVLGSSITLGSKYEEYKL